MNFLDIKNYEFFAIVPSKKMSEFLYLMELKKEYKLNNFQQRNQIQK